jgi:hypothetical protein
VCRTVEKIVCKKSNNRNKSVYCQGTTSHVIKTKHTTGAEPSDIVTCAKFGLHQYNGFGSGNGQLKVRCFPKEDGTAHTALHSLCMQVIVPFKNLLGASEDFTFI